MTILSIRLENSEKQPRLTNEEEMELSKRTHIITLVPCSQDEQSQDCQDRSLHAGIHIKYFGHWSAAMSAAECAHEARIFSFAMSDTT